jgi:outer membrane receptor protein involved in Fe transport
MPAVNVTYAPGERMNVRAGFSKTVARPELREMAPFDIYDYQTGFTEIGNTAIRSTPLGSYDVRWEFFPGSRELVAVSGFHKHIDHPIESFVQGSSGGYVLSPKNGDAGRVTGLELETRLGLSTLWRALDRALPFSGGPLPSLERWAFFVNYTRVKSSVRVAISTDAAGNPVYRVGPLGGQSTYALNAGVTFGSDAVDGSLLMSAFGRRLAQVGAGQYPSSLPDIYEYPLRSLDLTLGKRINSALRLKLTAGNLLNSTSEHRQLDKITQIDRPGRSYSIGIQWKD